MLVGYVRVSSTGQNTARQEVLMKELGVEELFMEKVSGKATMNQRPELEKLMSFVRKGDTVIVESISRFGRNIRHFLELMDMLEKKGVKFISKKENFDTSTPAGRFIMVIFAGLAELERDCILERQAEGIAIAKAEGRFNGRPKKELDNFESIYTEWKNENITAAKAAKSLSVARSTFYRKVRDYEAGQVIDY